MLGLAEYIDPPKTGMFPGYFGAAVKEEEDGQRRMHTLHWGLIPPWAKDPKEGRKFFNARAETVHEKPTYRSAFKSRRCLVPVTGWYEWKKGTRPKQKYFIVPKDNIPFVFAGIWQYWKDKDGKKVGSYSFLTVDPAGHLADIHNRMPLFILDPDHHKLWLDTANDNREVLYDYACKSIDRISASPLAREPKRTDPDQPMLF